jgi:hypothetical protein
MIARWLATYLDFFRKRDDVTFVQIHYTVNVDFALARAVGQRLAITSKILRVTHRFLLEAH